MTKFNNPLQKLRELADQPKPKRGSKKSFDNPLEEVTPKDAAKATKSKTMVGQYAQRTFRLPPEYLEMIRIISETEGMSVADAERWVIYRGLLAYFEDDERPEFVQTVQRQVQLPTIKK
jgi:hypothetical protein